jgi:hypothetical protein
MLYLKENTNRHHYKHQFLNAVQGNNRCLQRELYRTNKYEMHCYSPLNRLVHIVNIWI